MLRFSPASFSESEVGWAPGITLSYPHAQYFKLRPLRSGINFLWGSAFQSPALPGFASEERR